MSVAVRAAATSNARILSSLKPPLNVIVVGGTSGIGRAIALSIARHCPSANITIIGRNESAANAILPQLGSNPKFIRADASLMSEIRTVTKKINAVDMLVLTQGILTTAGRTPTTENIDNKLALHYYGRILFVQELLPLLRSSQNGGKVLFVFDSVHGNPSKINWNDMALEHTYSLSSAANHAMSFTDHAIQYFASQPENTNITFTHALPGFVRTTLGDNLPFWARVPLKCAKAIRLGITSEDCAELMVAHWCPPCRNFTPKLAEIYKRVQSELHEKLDIVFVSHDENENMFNEYFTEMPWKALSFSDRDRFMTLSKKFEVCGIPSLVVLTPSWDVLAMDGVEEVRSVSEEALRMWSQGKYIFWTRSPSEGEYVWAGIACTLCHMYPLVGTRHGCIHQGCNVDLCNTCISKYTHEHPLVEYLIPKKHYSLEQIFASVPHLLGPNNEEQIETKSLWKGSIKSIGIYFSADSGVVDKSFDHTSPISNHLIVWLDAYISHPQSNRLLKRYFNTIIKIDMPSSFSKVEMDIDNLIRVPYFYSIDNIRYENLQKMLWMFSNVDDCIEFIDALSNFDTTLFVISSGSLGRKLVPKIIKNNKIYSIYIFTCNILAQMDWAINYVDKVLMFNHEFDLLTRLANDIADYYVQKALKNIENLQLSLQYLNWAKKLHSKATIVNGLNNISVKLKYLESFIEQVEAYSDDWKKSHDDDTKLSVECDG
ncbi:unnamed protein product [Rotaria sp. Silwood1]|nr:unnamed protein product [Rotaria sp. Silwood1]CAF1458669.1 unnamed protein product [Rotaria sp. Silwood1]